MGFHCNIKLLDHTHDDDTGITATTKFVLCHEEIKSLQHLNNPW